MHFQVFVVVRCITSLRLVLNVNSDVGAEDATVSGEFVVILKTINEDDFYDSCEDLALLG
jgi:hypothetical protein